MTCNPAGNYFMTMLKHTQKTSKAVQPPGSLCCVYF